MKTMKKFIIAAALLLAGFATASAQKIKGSDTVLPLSQKEAEAEFHIFRDQLVKLYTEQIAHIVII